MTEFVEKQKCGEIILLSNTKFWFLCTFCDEHFQSIIVFRNHIKGAHITDEENVRNNKDENLLDFQPNKKCIIKLNSDGNFNEQVDIAARNCKPTIEYKLEGGVKLGEFNKEVQDLIIIDPSDLTMTNGMEEIIPTQTNKLEKNIKDSKLEESSQPCNPKSGNVTKINNRTKKALICKDIEDMQSNLKSQNRYQCEECGKCFRDGSNLRSHLVIHSGTRPYKCDFCDAGFSHSNSLKAHRYLHTGNRPYKCIECDKGFVSSGALKVHMREHTGETPYVCQFCQKAFATQCSHKKHMISHLGQRNYKCQQCEKAFIHKETLIRHIACHSAKKEFGCDICSKKFNHKKNLVQHQKLHLNIKQYICKICSKDFAQYAGLYSHMKYHKNK